MIANYESFKKEIFALTNIDLNAYKERQMKRRIDSLIKKNNYDDYNSYVKALKSNKDLFNEFVNYLTINVSEFYRNPEQWRILEEEIFPLLFKTFGKNIKIWSAACSTGDEPYSLAMLLAKFMPLSQVKIIATDIDKQVLSKAQLGLYNEKSLAALPKEFKDKYFREVGQSSYQIIEDIKKSIEFKQHNLLKDSYPTNCDLIVCRNVLIYFTEDAKSEIYKKFNQSLKKEGILFVGSTEQIIQPQLYKFSATRSFFYKKENNIL
ncbi:chemotaxis protein methyltransferase CheR [Natranaerovirga hydrolytica]|uniref:protein-glutamate O-methyltransferase n=1 Tax=Natranaerovirga hydrolytica TaxID=680378 RepID=A0A4R1MXK8_9FIRM|nr:protein-glutamate O-methyltransferase CheR [Natranaerovirga hydrolytica]TCK97997.1 chemotaxis protein methyltransferase CheR [Natranaerovirga hydrolytica]